MQTRVQRWLSPPVFGDEEQTRFAALLNLLLQAHVLIMILTIAFLLTQPPQLPFTWWVNGLTLLTSCSLLWIMRHGPVRLVGAILCLVVWAVSFYYVLINGGLASPEFAFLILAMLVGFTLFSTRGALVVGLLNMVGIGILYVAQSRGLLVSEEGPPLRTQWLISNSILYFLLTGVLAVSSHSVSKALARARNAERALAERNRELQREITEHTHAETVLSQERNLMRSVIDILPDNVFMKDKDGRFLLNNVVSMKLLGVSRQEDLLGKTDFDFFPHDVATFYAAKIEHLVSTGESIVEKEEFQPWQPNQWRWQISSVIPLRDEGGAVTGLVGRTTDITPQKRVEEALRKSEERYRIVSELISAFAFCIRLSPDGSAEVDWVTESFVRVTGSPLADLLRCDGIQLLTLFHPDDHEQMKAETARLLRGETVDNEYRIMTGADGLRWLHLYRQPVWDDAQQRVVCFYAAAQDITERKRVEQALRASEQQYRAIFEQTNDAIFLMNLKGEYLAVNPRAAQMFGFTVDELRGMSVQDLVPPGERPGTIQKLDALNARQSLPAYERTFLKKDGSTLTAEVSACVVPDSQGNPRYIQSVVRDITERKEVEKRRLELLVAQEKTATLRQFIAGLSHDLKTPLSVIDLNIHLLERLTDAQRQKQTMQVIKQQTLHLEHLIQDILTLANLNNITELTLKPTDGNQVVQYVATRFQALAEEKHLTMSLDLGPSPQLVLADEEELNRALVNLVENALDHTPGEGIITLRTMTRNDCVVIEVHDTGTGISPANLPDIFSRFYQADQVRTPQKAGLGLTIVKKIVELHHGTITVESHLGAGSSFKIILPRAA